jgi:2-amino-4-hydroxy-6-hydroxymethyldihydropteridine diphosphokinase
MDDAVFLGLGANLGDRATQMQQALDGLAAGGCRVVRVSALYETPPWGLAAQPAFYNAVVQVAYGQSPMDLLQLAMAVEQGLGRVRSAHWGPRLIDIDLLAFGQVQLVGQRLVVPHPLLQERAFVLVPWCEIAPDFIVPGLDKSVLELTAELPAAARVGIRPVGTLIVPA